MDLPQHVLEFPGLRDKRLQAGSIKVSKRFHGIAQTLGADAHVMQFSDVAFILDISRMLKQFLQAGIDAAKRKLIERGRKQVYTLRHFAERRSPFGKLHQGIVRLQRLDGCYDVFLSVSPLLSEAQLEPA